MTWLRKLAGAGLLVACTLLAYLPVYQAGFIWDDDAYVMSVEGVRDVSGLGRIWTEPRLFPQYYPLYYTTFWLEHQLWGLDPRGYHVVNVVLHACNALLFWRVLRRLGLPGAWVAAAVFALHPVHVESVAWVTERRNVLSALFYLLAMLAYLRFWLGRSDGATERGSDGATEVRATEEEARTSDAGEHGPPARAAGGWGAYALALLVFAAALLSKTVTCTLPAALLLVIWWRRGRLGWRDVLPLVPFLVLGIVLSAVTWGIESKVVGGATLRAAYTPVDRVLIAGRALWFYLGKLVLPLDLVHVYPRWTIDSQVWWQLLCPVAALGLLVALFFLRRRIGRGPLAALLFYGGTLAPTLGFINFGFMDHSLVADRFQYLASLGMIALVVGTLASAGGQVRLKRLAPVGVAGLLAAYGVGVWRQSSIYKDSPTLWRATLARNPNCAVGQYNLATDLLAERRAPEAIPHLEAAVAVRPDYFNALSDLGAAYLEVGRVRDALQTLNRAAQLRPNDELVHFNVALAFRRLGQFDAAAEHLRRAIEIDPNYAEARAALRELQQARGVAPR
jgi:hypothetical protein